eukprot:9434209-Lingulodinium_polyedra.AAC.1
MGPWPTQTEKLRAHGRHKRKKLWGHARRKRRPPGPMTDTNRKVRGPWPTHTEASRAQGGGCIARRGRGTRAQA